MSLQSTLGTVSSVETNSNQQLGRRTTSRFVMAWETVFFPKLYCTAVQQETGFAVQMPVLLLLRPHQEWKSDTSDNPCTLLIQSTH